MAQLLHVMSAGNSSRTATAIVGTCATALTAAGTSATDATLLSATNNEVTTTAASTGVRLPAGVPGDTINVGNYGAQTLSVYGQSGEAIASGAADAAFSVAANKSATFTRVSTTRWNANLSA